MAEYTYFIISPGKDLNSYVVYPDGGHGNYIKLSDQQSAKKPEHAGLRGQYLTHNPDIGVGAIMNSSVFSSPSLGTRLKTYIITTIGIAPVGSTEWFSIQTKAAWGLFGAMQAWDEKILTLASETEIKKVLHKYLT